MEWDQDQDAERYVGKSVVRVNDGTLAYVAEMPTGVSPEDVAAEFAATYDHGEAGVGTMDLTRDPYAVRREWPDHRVRMSIWASYALGAQPDDEIVWAWVA